MHVYFTELVVKLLINWNILEAGVLFRELIHSVKDLFSTLSNLFDKHSNYQFGLQTLECKIKDQKHLRTGCHKLTSNLSLSIS